MADRALEPRVASVDDAAEIAALLHDFNTEFDEPSPGVEVFTRRLQRLLAGDDAFALLAGAPGEAVGVAFATVRSVIWYDGPSVMLDELYVRPARRNEGIGTALITLLVSTAKDRGADLIEINVDERDVDAQRFYERHGFTSTEPDSTERSFFYWQELGET